MMGHVYEHNPTVFIEHFVKATTPEVGFEQQPCHRLLSIMDVSEGNGVGGCACVYQLLCVDERLRVGKLGAGVGRGVSGCVFVGPRACW